MESMYSSMPWWARSHSRCETCAASILVLVSSWSVMSMVVVGVTGWPSGSTAPMGSQ